MNSKGQLKAIKKQMRWNIKYLDDKAIKYLDDKAVVNRPSGKYKLSNFLR